MNPQRTVESTSINTHPLGLEMPAHGAIGYPSADPDGDIFAQFVAPPPGYGEVAFYWWVGDPLTRERLLWQLDKLAGMGIMGLQINYPHDDVGGNAWGLTTPSDPPVFSSEWWSLVTWFAGEAKKRNMSISLSDYTLSSPGQGQWTDEILDEMPDLCGSLLVCDWVDVKSETTMIVSIPKNMVAVTGCSITSGEMIDLREHIHDAFLTWDAPAGSWKIAVVRADAKAASINPLDSRSGNAVVQKFFQRFEDRLPGEAGKALNFFFSDELNFGIRGFLWHERFPEEFRKRKGYELGSEVAALFMDIGSRTPKVRLDYFDVMVALEEEHFFEPIFRWHHSRGMIYGGDHGGRGYEVDEFGDYFRTQRWMNGPGNDQSRLGTDCVRTKVHSSIAHLYQQPRVWLEGYYSSGWGTTPSDLVSAGVENYCLGSNLQTFHGLYYTTHGGWWEWAPPCNHFRMPYWKHMRPLMQWTERLCYLLSQGIHRCDVAVIYPVSPTHTGSGGQRSVDAAFAIVQHLYDQGIDCDLIDEQSVVRASVAGNELQVSGERYQALIIPAMTALRFETMERAAQFAQSGGLVIASGVLPSESDRVGREDPQLAQLVFDAFGNPPGFFVADEGQGPNLPEIAWLITDGIVRDFIAPRPEAHVLHRVIGTLDVFLVTQLHQGDECFFRASGRVELWDPWTGERTPILRLIAVNGGTRVTLPRDASIGILIVFSPQAPEYTISSTDLDTITEISVLNGHPIIQGFSTTVGVKSACVQLLDTSITVLGTAPNPPEPLVLDGKWRVSIEPTCDNTFGDYRLPVTQNMIGPEVRRLRYTHQSDDNAEIQDPKFDNAQWPSGTYGFGQRFWTLGPIPANADIETLVQKLAAQSAIDETQSINCDGQKLAWQPYAFSWREGIEGDPGHQGFHGLKGKVSDDFIGLGAPSVEPHPVFRAGYPTYVSEGDADSHYFLWTTVYASQDMTARLWMGDLKPASLWINGVQIDGDAQTVSLTEGANPMLAVYDQSGRTHLVLQDAKYAIVSERPTPLSMRWYDLPGRLNFEPNPHQLGSAVWYRFTSAPGLLTMTVTVHGELSAWSAGEACSVDSIGVHRDGAKIYQIQISSPISDTSVVALRVIQKPGYAGTAAISEPIEQICGEGEMSLGDWSQIDGLASYSGCIIYRKSVFLTEDHIAGRVTLKLGSVAASAQITINDHSAGTCLTPPWELDITRFVHAGANTVEIEVCNTLANHYQTIPTEYRGSALSGLMGPVTIETAVTVTLSDRVD